MQSSHRLSWQSKIYDKQNFKLCNEYPCEKFIYLFPYSSVSSQMYTVEK